MVVYAQCHRDITGRRPDRRMTVQSKALSFVNMTMCVCVPLYSYLCESQFLGAVYMAQVFASNETLLLQFGLPFTWQRRAGTPENTNIWNWVPEWNLLKPQPSFRLCKLASGVPVNAVSTLMLMLAQVNALCSGHFQTLIKHPEVYQR